MTYSETIFLADIFREVDEDIRREGAKQLWDKYGIYVIGMAVGIVAITSGVVGWNAYKTSQAEEAAVAFLRAGAEATVEGADSAAIYAQFAQGAPVGYVALAHLSEAGSLATAGDIEGAIAVYETVAGNSNIEDILRDLARVKAGALLVGRASYDDLAGRLLPLTGATQAWRNPAREVLGLAAYRAQEYTVARNIFQEIVDDRTSTQGIRDRAHVMIALIDPHRPAAVALDSAPEETEDGSAATDGPDEQATPNGENAPRDETSEATE